MMTVRELMALLAEHDDDELVELWGGEGEGGCYAALAAGRQVVLDWSEDEDWDDDEEE